MRFGFAIWLAAAGGVAGAAGVASCGPTESSCEELATCPVAGGADGSGGSGGSESGVGGQSGTGGTDGALVDASGEDAGSDVAPAPCGDARLDPQIDACVDDDHDVFVSTGGDDAGSGHKGHPYKTIGHALSMLGAAKRIFVCKGEYPETLTIDATVDGAHLYGGLDCEAWTYAAT